MADATTERFEEMTLELETDTPDTYGRPCGLIGVTFSRAATVDEVETPDCDDESLPLAVEREVRRIDVSLTATGVWAAESQQEFLDWFYSSAPKNIRVGNAAATSGQTQYEQGAALLTQYDQVRAKGKRVEISVTILFDGRPTRVAAP